MNPFSISSRSKNHFCNRVKEIAMLQNNMRSGIHTVVYAPRRFGKSSLAGMLQDSLNDMDNIYVELFSVTSIDDVARLIYRGIMNVLGRDAAKKPALLKRMSEIFNRVRLTLSFDASEGPKIDVSLGDSAPAICLQEVILSLDAYCKKSNRRVCLVLDEFQEICNLKESRQIEAFLREGMQNAEMVSFLFMGSRRTILRDMFEGKKRPFYKSTVKLELEPIPVDEFADFIIRKFGNAGHAIDISVAEEIVSFTDGYPYYTQKLAMFYFDAICAGSRSIDASKLELVKSESTDFENIFVTLTSNQKKVFKALARKPTSNIYSKDYLYENHLGAASSVRTAVEKLRSLDLIEVRNGLWRTVDPILEKWICASSA